MVGNAIKFTSSGTIDDAAAHRTGTRWRGTALRGQRHRHRHQANQVRQLFQPFRRSTPASRGAGGLACGTASMASSLQLMGGRVSLDSVPGQNGWCAGACAAAWRRTRAYHPPADNRRWSVSKPLHVRPHRPGALRGHLIRQLTNRRLLPPSAPRCCQKHPIRAAFGSPVEDPGDRRTLGNRRWTSRRATLDIAPPAHASAKPCTGCRGCARRSSCWCQGCWRLRRGAHRGRQ